MSGLKSAATTRRRVVAALSAALFAVVVLRNAWMHDDAYITFRTVDNFVNGYGLRWNTVERVQTYTHPLWMLAVSACYAVTHEVFFTVIGLSVVVSTATALMLMSEAAGSLAAGCVGVAVLTSSKAFVDYSTSGLENPLTHFLFTAFLVLLFRRKPNMATLYLLSSVAALGASNRLDTVLLYLPALVMSCLRTEPRARALAVAAAGFAPLVLWEGFSLLYYGFLFPNTAYAKLFAAGISSRELARHGLYYLLNSVRLDPLTLLTVGAGVVAGLLSRDRRQAAIAGGILAYLAYIIYVGGDFVTGRFLGGPLLGAVVLLTRWQPMPRTAIGIAAGVVLVVGMTSSSPPLLSTSTVGSQGKTLMDDHGVADERAYYYPYTGLLRAFQGVRVSDHPWAVEGREARRRSVPLAFRGDVGFFGFHAGPGVHVVDVWGLGDPLIARLPARTDVVSWRVGHFTRAMPEGYPETLATGRNHLTDRETGTLYDQLVLITRGDLLARRRLVEIWKLNTGSSRNPHVG
jgi:arabinofuranosyltransferase